jgi:hypothetical protein
MVPYYISNTRPDGTLIGSPTKFPGRDVLIFTDLYVHQNNEMVTSKWGKMHPVGFYIVVWDNGEIQRIPYDQSLKMRMPDNAKAWLTVFPGQAGVDSTAIPYRKYYRQSL